MDLVLQRDDEGDDPSQIKNQFDGAGRTDGLLRRKNFSQRHP
ncbi:MAG: hypothetical protein WCG60_00480 [bacterium]